MHFTTCSFIIALLALQSLFVKGQTGADSVTQKLIRQVANRFAEARPVNIEYNYNGDFNFPSKAKSSSLTNGKVTRFSSLRTNLNYTIAKNRKWIVSTAFQYRMASVAANYKPGAAPIYQVPDSIPHDHAACVNEWRVGGCNNGFIYEHLLSDNIVLTTKAGSRLSVMGRAFEKSTNSGNPYFDGSLKPGFYCNVGLSVNPFVKKK